MLLEAGEIGECAGFGGVWLFYRKVFSPPENLCVMCFFLYLFSVCMVGCNIVVYMISNLQV